MARDPFEPRRRIGRLFVLLLVALVLAGAWFLRGALRQGPAAQVTIEAERAAIGKSTKVAAKFREPGRGLGSIKFELIQGERSVVLGEKSFPRRGPFSFGRGTPTAEAEIAAVVGRSQQDWLKEGEAILRATADRMAGMLRGGAPVVVEHRMQVRQRPPRLELLSQQHYVRQGGAGVVVIRVDDAAKRYGVRAGKIDFDAWPMPGGGAGEKFVLYAAPWDEGEPGQIKIFAEDDAGNRVELPFITIFKKAPPRTDRIEVSDAFLEQVVPAIAAESPGFVAEGSLLDQYLRINGEMRRENLARLVELSKRSEARFLWSGAFLQMANSARRAGFAETRTYTHKGKDIDRQTHLGLDLASLSRAAAPAPNSGRVLFAGWLGIYGNVVVLDHGYGLMSLCGHLSSTDVKEGDLVEKGRRIGATGATGLAGGDHLHLEIFVQGKSVDPVEWLDEHWIRDNLGTKLPLTTGG